MLQYDCFSLWLLSCSVVNLSIWSFSILQYVFSELLADDLKRSIDEYNDAQRKWVEDTILGLVVSFATWSLLSIGKLAMLLILSIFLISWAVSQSINHSINQLTTLLIVSGLNPVLITIPLSMQSTFNRSTSIDWQPFGQAFIIQGMV